MGEGERLHEERRKRFWGILGGLMIVGLLTGGFAGAFIGAADHNDGPFPAWALAAGTAGVILMSLGVAYGSWRFFAAVDELELADNLWASLVGFYAYAILFPAWWALSKLGVIAEPNDWTIYAATLLSATAVYFYRKVRYS